MNIGRLAAQLAAGLITAEAIERTYGDDVLVQVLAASLGASLGGSAYDAIDDMLDGTISELFGF